MENASLHGCNLLGQCICPWMDGSRTTQEQLSRSYCRGAILSHSIRGDSLELFQTIISNRSFQGDSLELFQTIISNRSFRGDSLELFQTILSIRPTWMWEVQKMQELFSATPSMEIKNEKLKNE